jgi:hypothetical protein
MTDITTPTLTVPAVDWINLTDDPVAADAGIPAGYFIKPDPVLTRVETRRYLLEELERYLKGPLLTDALATAVAAGPATSVLGMQGPASRLARLYSLLKDAGKLPEGSVSEQMAYVAKWIFSVIQASLTVGAPSAPTDYEELAMAFWNVDLLPNKKTIGSYWDYSPFEALRRAPPLTEVDDDAVPPLPATASASAEEEDYTDMPPLVPIDSTFRGPASTDEEDYSDMPGLISLEELARQQPPPAGASEEQEEQEEYVTYSKMPQLPQSLIDTVGGSVEALFNLALRPVSVPVWGIALAVAILPTLLMSKC